MFPDQVAQGFGQPDPEQFQWWRLDTFHGQPALLLACLHREKVALYITLASFMLLYVLARPPNRNHWAEPGFTVLIAFL